jgi:hypothetical protein
MSDIELTRELLMPYQGLDGREGLCHVRVYEALGRLPVVIVGGLDDNPGTAIALVIETVAAAVQRRLFADGRQFHLIEHYRDPIEGLQTSRYALVRFGGRSVVGGAGAWDGAGVRESAEVREGAGVEGDFRDPRWEPIDDIEELLGCQVAVWWPGRYTARAVAGRLPSVHRPALQRAGWSDAA